MCNVEQGAKVLQPFAQACTLLNETSLKTNMYCDCGKDSFVGLECSDNR